MLDEKFDSIVKPSQIVHHLNGGCSAGLEAGKDILLSKMCIEGYHLTTATNPLVEIFTFTVGEGKTRKTQLCQ